MSNLDELASKNVSLKFSSPALSSALKKSSNVFENYVERIDSISADIRNLETYLKQNRIGLPHSLSLQEHHNREIQPFSIMWQDSGKNSFRIMFREMELDEYENVSFTESKPLLEAPLNVRILLYPLLPEFISSLAEAIGTATCVMDFQNPTSLSAIDHFGEDLPF